MDVFMKSVVGHKNLIRNRKTQDYIDSKRMGDMLICVVADGHSTDFFKYSYEGAKFACRACIEILENYYDKSKEEWEVLLSDKIIQKLIYAKWMELVNDHYNTNNPIVFKTEYIKYSTTLIACCVFEEFIVSIMLGDGNIVIKKNNEYKKIINFKEENIVKSLGRINAYENIKYSINNIKSSQKDNQIVLFTDGYENSFIEEKELFKSIDKTINKYNNNVFSRMRLYDKYENYLNKLSKNVSHDDISIIFIF